MLNKEIIFSILIAFLISFSILLLVNLLYNNDNSNNAATQNIIPLQFSNNTLIGDRQMDRDGTLELQSIFFSKWFDLNEKKIFILGSSEVKAINTTQVHEYLLYNDRNYTVYNLAIPADRPESRWNTNSLELIIETKPEIILYGISYRDFMDALPNVQSSNKPTNSPLPDPSRMLPEIYFKLKSYTNNNLEFLDNPKLVTLSLIKSEGRTFLGVKNPADGALAEPGTIIPYPNAIFKVNHADITTLSDQQLKNHFFIHGVEFNGISVPWENPHVISFEKIIDKLGQNNIKVIVFTTPKSKYYLNSMPVSEKEHFDSILDDISKKHHVKIYQTLWDKYKNLEVWSDPTHVSINSDGLIYSTDIAKIILNETNP